jgi:hypothetical protein
MARLEEAERKLRAKRKPAKGKLDEIDERLQNLSLQEMEAENAKTQAEELKTKLQETMGAGLRSTQKMPAITIKKDE